MNELIHETEGGERVVRLTPGKRVLFLTKDLELIRKQLRGELDLRMEDVDPADLLDDINTDTMTPACASATSPRTSRWTPTPACSTTRASASSAPATCSTVASR